MNPNWTMEQVATYLQVCAIIYGNLSVDMPAESAIALAKSRAAALINDPELFPPTP